MSAARSCRDCPHSRCRSPRSASLVAATRVLFGAVFLLFSGIADAANPFVVWKERLFGARPLNSPVREAAAEGVVVLGIDRPEHLRIGRDSEQREFPAGKSRYREVELQREFAHVALRIQVIARSNPQGRGNAVFKPIVYLLDDRGEVRESKPVEPLYLDIRPFQPTRLLACVPLENVRRFALAMPAAALGKSYESKARDKVNASSKSGFYYATDPIKVNLPYIDTGDLIVEVARVNGKDEGC